MRMFVRSTVAISAVALAASAWGTPTAAQQVPDSSARRTQRALDSLGTAMRELQARMDSLKSAVSVPAPAPQARASGSYMNMSFDGLGDAGWSSVRNVRSIERGDHDPRVRGFTIPNAELVLDGTVDPYFKGFSNVVLKLDENGETGVEIGRAHV